MWRFDSRDRLCRDQTASFLSGRLSPDDTLTWYTVCDIVLRKARQKLSSALVHSPNFKLRDASNHQHPVADVPPVKLLRFRVSITNVKITCHFSLSTKDVATRTCLHLLPNLNAPLFLRNAPKCQGHNPRFAHEQPLNDHKHGPLGV